MLNPRTCKPLTLKDARSALVKKRKTITVEAEEHAEVDIDEWEIEKRGIHAWKLKEVAEADAFCMLDFKPHSSKVNQLSYAILDRFLTKKFPF